MWIILLAGFVAGVLSGLMGVGGGILLVPAMVLLLGFSQHRAHGTSLAVIIPIVLFGAFSYCRHGNIDWMIAVELAVGGVFGATVGAKLAAALPSKKLKKLFALLLLFMAFRMLYDAISGTGAVNQIIHVSATGAAGGGTALLVVATGIAAGALSGLMGIGGGIIMIPAMVYLLHIDQKLAQGISLLVIIPISISGTIAHFVKGNVDINAGKWLALGGVTGGCLGAHLVHQCSDTALRLMFGAFLLLMAALTLRRR